MSIDEDPKVVRVTKIGRRRDLMLPSLLLSVAGVALVGFLVGYRVGPGPAPQASPTMAASVSPAAASGTGADPSLSLRADVTPCPGACTSVFLDLFSPATIVPGLPGGGDCTIHDFSGTALGSQVVRSWSIYCSLEIGGRTKLVDALIRAIVGFAPGPTEAGWSTDEFGAAQALIPYQDADYSGTITVTADDVPPGYEIVITIVESPTAPGTH